MRAGSDSVPSQERKDVTEMVVNVDVREMPD